MIRHTRAAIGLTCLMTTALAGSAIGQHPLNVAGGKVDTTRTYKFVPGERRVNWRRYTGDIAWGHLDKYGNFVRDEKVPVGLSTGSHPQAVNDPRRPQGGHEEVYEYRCGRLIKGRLGVRMGEGEYGGTEFLPEVGSTISEMKDYPLGEKALRIYNLPGEFVPVEESR